MSAYLQLNDVHKRYGNVHAIDGVNLSIERGEFVVFVGPSGCGKSTLLRMIAGLEEVDDGTVVLDGRDITDLASSKRDLAMVFQSYALYPHMSVAENMSFALKLAGVDKSVIDEKVTNAANILDLHPYLSRMPGELSGGQRQRVAIGRAIVRDPKVFLFDEPLSNLDASLRGQTRVEIARLHRNLGATTIYVTHDQTEAMTLADRVVVMRAGRIEQAGSPMTLYDNPANQFVAQFIGMPRMNVLPSQVVPELAGLLKQPVADGSQVGVRPEAMALTPAGQGLLDARVELIEALGAETLVHLRRGDDVEMVVRVNGRTTVGVGDIAGVTTQAESLHLFDSEGQSLQRATQGDAIA
jgi:multiple sugar transport system ATP-binding protein